MDQVPGQSDLLKFGVGTFKLQTVERRAFNFQVEKLDFFEPDEVEKLKNSKFGIPKFAIPKFAIQRESRYAMHWIFYPLNLKVGAACTDLNLGLKNLGILSVIQGGIFCNTESVSILWIANFFHSLNGSLSVSFLFYQEKNQTDRSISPRTGGYSPLSARLTDSVKLKLLSGSIGAAPSNEIQREAPVFKVDKRDQVADFTSLAGSAAGSVTQRPFASKAFPLHFFGLH